MNEELINNINSHKEILSTLPTNNIKNRNKYIEEIDTVLKTYVKYKENTLIEIEKRYKSMTNIEINKNIDLINKNIKNIEENLYLLNNFIPTYQKSSLDKILYEIGHFYKTNLEKINIDIYSVIELFKNIGINLTKEDFNYSRFAYEYMSDFFKSYEKDKENYYDITPTFESIYWKCPDVIMHIELNIKYLFYKYNKEFDLYVESKKNSFLKKINKNINDIRNEYTNLVIEYMDNINNDKYLIINDFINKNKEFKDYVPEKINKNISSLVKEKYLTEDNKENNYLNIIKLNHSIIEYKEIMHFEYILDKVLSLYKDKDKYKDIFKNKKIELDKIEKELFKINTKYDKMLDNNKKSKFGLFGKNNDSNVEKNSLTINNKILDIKKVYDEINEDTTIKELIYKNLNIDSTLYDLFKLVYYNYEFLIKCIKEKDEEMNEEDIKKEIDRLYKFILNPYNLIINNTSILNEKDLKQVIADKYIMLNLKLTEEELTEDNIDNLINITKNIIYNYYLEKNNIKINDIEFIYNANNIILNK